jgi:hypothetical protein
MIRLFVIDIIRKQLGTIKNTGLAMNETIKD